MVFLCGSRPQDSLHHHPGQDAEMLKNLKLVGMLNRGTSSHPSGRVWPDGTFSLGYVRERPDERLDDRSVDICLPGDEGTDAAPPLDLRNVPNSHNSPQCPLSAGEEGTKGAKRPERYGRQGMTGYGKKMVRSVGALIDRYYPHHRVTFATITMPSLPGPLRKELAQLWPELVRHLMQWLKRRLVKKGQPGVIVSVTEIQTGRLEATDEGYLHLHLLWLNPPAVQAGWSVRVENLRAWVADWLIRHGLWEENSHVNVDTRSVKGEKSRYLAKYASKGTDEIEAFASDCGWESVPSQWWNLTNKARTWVKEHTFEGRGAGELLDALVNSIFELSDFQSVRYIYHIDIDIGGRLVNVGWRGCLSAEGYDDVTQMLQTCYNRQISVDS